MWGRFLDSEPCVNYRCPHNLLWDGLKLNLSEIQITDKTLEIGNCCCFVHEPWAPEEIGTAWGVAEERISRCESKSWKRLR